ncbi:hypothetical protein SAMN06296386_10712 [Lachnospiraceae bacterium]|nr:hypothetical protein SAMN06296386_10712 [Lachnospiraceae bacterium]
MKKELEEVISPELEKVGFGELKTIDGNWAYERTVKGCVQRIVIYTHRFDKNKIRYQLFVDAGKGGIRSDILNILTENEAGTADGFWEYDGTEENLKVVLEEILASIIDKGIPRLEKLSSLKPNDQTGSKYVRLEAEHDLLDERFIQRKAPVVDRFDEESVSGWINLIEEDMDENADEITRTEHIFEAAAFLSHRVIEFAGAEWVSEDVFGTKFFRLGKVPHPFVDVDYLGRISAAFKDNNKAIIRRDLEKMLKAVNKMKGK